MRNRRGPRLRHQKPKKDQYIGLLCTLADCGLVEWVPGPDGPLDSWRFREEALSDDDAAARLRGLERLNPVERRMYVRMLGLIP